jgi:hypothetical protein
VTGDTVVEVAVVKALGEVTIGVTELLLEELVVVVAVVELVLVYVVVVVVIVRVDGQEMAFAVEDAP